MTFTDGSPTVTGGEPAFVFVTITDVASAGGAGGATPAQAPANVVARALLDARHSGHLAD